MRLSMKSILVLGCTICSIFILSSANNNDIEMRGKVNVDTWSTRTSMPTGRYSLVSEVVDGKIYAIGGYDKNSLFNIVEMYNPETDKWEAKENMPTGRHALTSEVIDNKIYTIGGYRGQDKMEVYDPKTDTWEVKSSIPTSRNNLSSSVVNGKIYLLGGRSGSNVYVSAVDVYDPKTDTWEVKASIPTPRSALTSSVVDGKIYTIGGWNGSSRFDTVEMYDPETDVWETKSSIPTPRSDAMSTVIDGKIYVIGGESTSPVYSNKVEVYDPKTDTWEVKASMPVSKGYSAISEINGKIFLMGGWNGDIPLNTVDVYTAKLSEEEEAENSVIDAENSRDIVDIEIARNLVNKLSESSKKDLFQDRLNTITPDLDFKRLVSTTNMDVYIKFENALSVSLNTNKIMFDEFSGVEDVEKQNAVNMTVSSSLPYTVKAYLASEIQNSDKTKIMDKSILNIKASTESTYKAFIDTVTPVVLLDNQLAGDDISQGVDLKLKSNVAHEKDVYKATIKFEIEQR